LYTRIWHATGPMLATLIITQLRPSADELFKPERLTTTLHHRALRW
jgi:hypothetical protein